jgi:Putative adhesin
MSRRILTGISAAIATVRRKVASGSLAALVARIPPAWRRPGRLIFAAAVLLVIVLIVVTRPAPAPAPRHPAGTRVFRVSGNRVVLRFVHSNGSVHVTAGPAGQVSIKEDRNGLIQAINTRYRQSGDAVTVTVSVENGLPTATWVDFDVAVPRNTNATVDVAAGTLRAAGVTGNFVLQDTNGSIWASNVTGAMALRTTSGSINTSEVNGQVSAITENGTITAISTRLGGHSLVQAQSGTISFHGRLDSGCHAVFRNTNGAIAITLPRSSSVLVDARTPDGSINSEFSSVHVASQAKDRVASGRIGRDAPARLSIQTKSGSIDLNHGVP